MSILNKYTSNDITVTYESNDDIMFIRNNDLLIGVAHVDFDTVAESLMFGHGKVVFSCDNPHVKVELFGKKLAITIEEKKFCFSVEKTMDIFYDIVKEINDYISLD